MGYRKPENRGLGYHLSTPSSIRQMRSHGWRIAARCTSCQLDIWIDLSVMMRLGMGDEKLFGRSTSCRRLNCPGRMVFMGTPPGEPVGVYYVLHPIRPSPDPRP